MNSGNVLVFRLLFGLLVFRPGNLLRNDLRRFRSGDQTFRIGFFHGKASAVQALRGQEAAPRRLRFRGRLSRGRAGASLAGHGRGRERHAHRRRAEVHYARSRSRPSARLRCTGTCSAATSRSSIWNRGQIAHAMVIAPASADMLARLAHGLADDMLSAQALAFDGPVVVAPAMNPRMWRNPATQANVETLRERGFTFVGPDCGVVACHDEGQGRLCRSAHDLPCRTQGADPAGHGRQNRHAHARSHARNLGRRALLDQRIHGRHGRVPLPWRRGCAARKCMPCAASGSVDAQ